MKKIKYIAAALLLSAIMALTACGAVTPASVTLNKTALTLTVGETAKLAATVAPEGAAQDVVWASSDETVATVAADGTVTAVGEGLVAVTAACAGDDKLYADCEIEVNAREITVVFMADGKAVSTQKINSGERAQEPNEPIKAGHVFLGWYTAESGGTLVTDFTNQLNDATYYARFEKSDGPVYRTFKFEAEFIDFKGLVGSGISGSALETQMIQDGGMSVNGASNDWFVGFLHGADISLTWNVTADAAAAADLYISLASELGSLDMTPGEFEITVNGVAVGYDYIEVWGDAGTVKFEEYKLNVPVALKEGENKIVVTVRENLFNGGESTGGPMVDYIKLGTTAILTWEPVYNVVSKT